MDQVVWGIFQMVFRRSCGLPTRSVGPTDRSADLLVGRTHLSGTAMSLVGGDPWGTHVSQVLVGLHGTSPSRITGEF
jgi:hypothetical protein